MVFSFVKLFLYFLFKKCFLKIKNIRFLRLVSPKNAKNDVCWFVLNRVSKSIF